jgi:hypothetical protein
VTQLPYPATHEEVLELKQRYKNKSVSKKIEKMHMLYGRHENALFICGDCWHCVGMEHAKTYWKCKLYGITGGPGTDWTRKWPACGKYEARI